MSNLPLKPLKWEDREDSAMVTTMFRGYWVTSDTESKDKFCTYYGSSTGEPARGFATIEDAKHWAEHEHYASEMQQYVKPSPTWIDASKQLPEKNTTVLVVYHAHFDDEKVTEFDVCTAFFDGETFDTKDQLFYQKRNTTVVRWMPIPEFSKQGECCE